MAKILIVEDDLYLRDIYEKSFKDLGYVVLTADDGQSALTLAKQNTDASLMILDIMLPKVNGMEVLKTMKSDEALKKIPVIILTNLSEESVLEEGYKLGAVDSILKVSMTPAEVVARVTGLLSSKAQDQQ